MIDEIEQDAEARMAKSLEALRQALARIRTGRAHPSLLDHILVNYYGSEVPLKQVANITVEDARTLAITPWEKSMVQPIEKAILQSDLGINPNTAGAVIRIILPPLTEDRRKALIKRARQEGEQGRVAIRNIRRDANASLKEMVKEKMISEDEERRGQEHIQKLTDRFIKQVDQLLEEKERDLITL